MPWLIQQPMWPCTEYLFAVSHVVVLDLQYALARQARQLESLVRLAEARARVELSQTVTREHAEVRRPPDNRAATADQSLSFRFISRHRHNLALSFT